MHDRAWPFPGTSAGSKGDCVNVLGYNKPCIEAWAKEEKSAAVGVFVSAVLGFLLKVRDPFSCYSAFLLGGHRVSRLIDSHRSYYPPANSAPADKFVVATFAVQHSLLARSPLVLLLLLLHLLLTLLLLLVITPMLRKGCSGEDIGIMWMRRSTCRMLRRCLKVVMGHRDREKGMVRDVHLRRRIRIRTRRSMISCTGGLGMLLDEGERGNGVRMSR